MAKLQCVHDPDPNTPNKIETFMHCSRCLRERPRGEQSPAEWARLSIGFTMDGQLQVWCERHQLNVDHMVWSIEEEE